MFSSPLLLGFDDLDRLLERALKASGEGYPPYNIERLPLTDGSSEVLRITIAVAGFQRQDLETTHRGQSTEHPGTDKGRWRPELPAPGHSRAAVPAGLCAGRWHGCDRGHPCKRPFNY
jgi:hypothetical protein